MQNAIATAVKYDRIDQVISPGTANHLPNRIPGVNIDHSCTLSGYHAGILEQIGSMKAASNETARTSCQEAVIHLSLRAIAMYARLFLIYISRLKKDGLSHFAYMITVGSSLHLNMDEQGESFARAAAISVPNLYDKTSFFILESNYREGDHGIYISHMKEILYELGLFCNDHPLYEAAIHQLMKCTEHPN